MISTVLDERFKHALKERAVPGLLWGTVVGGLLTALPLVFGFRITTADAVVATAIVLSALILIGIIFGAMSTYWWKNGRSQSPLPVEETGKAWWLVPVGFAVIGLVIILLLNISTRQYMNQKDYLLSALAFLIGIYDFILIGIGLGSLFYLLSAWLGKRVRERGTSAQSKRKGFSLTHVFIGGAGMLIIVALVLLFTRSGGTQQPPPKTRVPPTETGTPVELPTWPPTSIPTATLVQPTLPSIPQPPVGSPVSQPPTIAPVRLATATRTRTPVPAASATRVLVCSYTTVTGDTWSSVATKLEVTISALIAKNPNANPAQPGTLLKSPRPGCP